MVESAVLDHLASDVTFLAGCANDVNGSGVGLEAAGVGKPLAVVADLGQHPGAKLDAESEEAQDHLGV